MVYLTSFFHPLYPQHNFITVNDLLKFNDQASDIGIGIYEPNVGRYVDVVKHVVKHTNHLHLYLGEPCLQEQFLKFLNQFDLPTVTFYSDSILNFNLRQAKFIPTINWFIDPINYYTESKWGIDLLNNLTHLSNRPFLFDMLLGQHKTHRDCIESLYLASNHKDKIIYSYFRTNIANGICWNSNMTPSNHLWTSELFDIAGEEARISSILPVSIYNQSYYSIISETTTFNSYNQYTEKVAKPILAKRPFIAFAGQYYLRNLRSLGFKTFDGIIDETYDTVEDLNLRTSIAWQQVEWLCEQDPDIIINKLQPILDYNQQHFLNTDWVLSIKNLF